MDFQNSGSSTIGKLLEEVSWETAANYRSGGRGRENVLTAEFLIGLDFLPRDLFLGGLLRAAKGADLARMDLASEAEGIQLQFLPGDLPIAPNQPGQHAFIVQPDAMLTSERTVALVEAKRIRASSFQPEQLARQYVALMANRGERTPLLLLLGAAPPVLLRGLGRMSIHDAVSRHIDAVLERGCYPAGTREELMHGIDEVFCWIAWADAADVIKREANSYLSDCPSTTASIRRIADASLASIKWHS
ncbi:hypothetical protein GCM10009715_13140 [Paeniglutamicibacter psychrophenolicus]|uniref:Uncharacterized protein n=1 Tax=Paeniglutamicibacter psychrophenolicus TaxID=257454 RepID=A0ABS4W9I7_9MICC|nr:hypothetical protein [Paeniglutamicibacter psychrophenolicus]MBP2372264.1 hypothetical protein [Paeniglutamicibacter psychrophenolicus]